MEWDVGERSSRPPYSSKKTKNFFMEKSNCPPKNPTSGFFMETSNYHPRIVRKTLPPDSSWKRPTTTRGSSESCLELLPIVCRKNTYLRVVHREVQHDPRQLMVLGVPVLVVIVTLLLPMIELVLFPVLRMLLRLVGPGQNSLSTGRSGGRFWIGIQVVRRSL